MFWPKFNVHLDALGKRSGLDSVEVPDAQSLCSHLSGSLNSPKHTAFVGWLFASVSFCPPCWNGSDQSCQRQQAVCAVAVRLLAALWGV